MFHIFNFADHMGINFVPNHDGPTIHDVTLLGNSEERGEDAVQVPAFDENGSNSLHVDGACNSPSIGLGKQPIGRDKAKESRKRSTSSSQS